MSEPIRNTYFNLEWLSHSSCLAQPDRDLWTRGFGAVLIPIPNCSCTESNTLNQVHEKFDV